MKKVTCDTCFRTIHESDDTVSEGYQCESCWRTAQEREAKRWTEGFDETWTDGGRRSDTSGRL